MSMKESLTMLLILLLNKDLLIDFFEERSFLIPLAQTSFISTKKIFRKVTSDRLISYNGDRYTVPWPYTGKHVWIRLSQEKYLRVFSQKGVLIATHTLIENKGMTIIDQKDQEGLKKRLPKTKKLFEEVFLEELSEARSFLGGLLVHQKFNISYPSCPTSACRRERQEGIGF